MLSIPRVASLSAVLLLAILSSTASSIAELPSYEPRLVARSNFTGAFQLPDSAFFTNSTPSLDDSGRVAIYLSFLPGDVRGVFLEGAGVAYTSPTGALLGDVSLNDQGFVVFPQRFSAQDGVYFVDDGDGSSGFLTNLPFGASTWGSPQVDAQERIGLRAGFANGQTFAIIDGDTVTNVAVEAGLDAGSPYSFLFTPSFGGGDAGVSAEGPANGPAIAGKVRLGANGQTGGSQPDQVRVFRDGSSLLIAEDADSDSESELASFDNGVSYVGGVTGDRVAFIATLDDGVRGVFVGDGTTITTIARDDDPEVTGIEFFRPALSASGLVAFRGLDANGLQALFVGDGTDLRRVVGEHDLVPTDLGTARIDQNDDSPVFGGAPSINSRGDVAIHAALTPPDDDQVEWGSGLFVFSAGVLFTDGFESGDTTAWSPSP